MMASNVALEFKNTGNTNICSRHYLQVKFFRVSRHKSVFTNQKKKFATFEFEYVEKSKEQKNSKQRLNSSVFENQKSERIQNVQFVQLLSF